MVVIILGIESSCDDTSAALLGEGGRVLSNIVSSQIEAHRKFGGVVPEIASRHHIEAISPIVEEAMNQADVRYKDLNGVAATYGPGLAGSLLVGLSFAKALAYSLNIPFIGVDHIEGHLWSPCLENEGIAPPFLGLVVSGGHSDIIYVDEEERYIPIGRTRDDAAGEAFDKVAKVLNLGYPGGPAIDSISQRRRPRGERTRFPRARMSDGSLDYSFSGIKTAVATYVRERKLDESTVEDVASSFQDAVVDMLVRNCIRAAEDTRAKTILLGGGVAANTQLRQTLEGRAKEIGAKVYYPSPKYCTDNAAMIAFVGRRRLMRGEKSPLNLKAETTLRLGRKF
ncbi:MAG: tRNA (adenosine(37)-N6)-threonylcarbamoyltransferase complex transferase subunit TsaD [bacterium]